METRVVNEGLILKELRRICLALPGANEIRTWGHPTFRAGKKTFAVLDEYQGQLSIAFKVSASHQYLFLKDSRFFRTPYIGRHGWVSLKTAGRLDWTEVRHLLIESYRLVASKKTLAQLESSHAQTDRTKQRRNRRRNPPRP